MKSCQLIQQNFGKHALVDCLEINLTMLVLGHSIKGSWEIFQMGVNQLPISKGIHGKKNHIFLK